MIDLINKTDEEINQLILKYSKLIDYNGIKELPQYLTIIDISIDYLKSNYTEVESDIKAWTIFLVSKLYKLNYIMNDKTIIYNLIDDFIQYYNLEHEKYCEDIAISSSDFYKNIHFIYDYINNKISNIS